MAHLKDRIVQVLGYEADIIVMGWLVGYLPRRGKESIEGADDEIDDDDEEQEQMRVTGRQFRHEPPLTAILAWFTDAVDYKSTTSLTNFTSPVKHAAILHQPSEKVKPPLDSQRGFFPVPKAIP
jgi:hypothetical protein